MGIFNRGDSDKVTYGDLQEYARAYVRHDEADTFVEDTNGALARLDERLGELEALASQLRVTQGAQNAQVVGAARRQAESVVARTDALTRADAEGALRELRNAGAAEFERLHAKIDAVVSQFVNREVAERTETATPQPPVVGGTTGVDYGAVAFGLSQIKRDVANVLGSEVREADLRAHYRQTVQYFADVLAKSDPSFDAALFTSQAGA